MAELMSHRKCQGKSIVFIDRSGVWPSTHTPNFSQTYKKIKRIEIVCFVKKRDIYGIIDIK